MANEKKRLRVLSLGAGVQSSTLALMIAHGEIDPVDCAIFADTRWESDATYEWLDWLEQQLPFQVHRVSAGDIRENILRGINTTGGRFVSIPFFTRGQDGANGIGRRQCTSEYKIKPIRAKKRDLLGYKPRARIPHGSVETLIGISLDEAIRMKPSRDKWDVNRWPLIDKRMTRDDCLAWMRRHGYPLPPKSSCLGCPYHSNNEWRLIKANSSEWNEVVQIDRMIREPARGMRGRQYMHSSRVPLEDVDLSTASDHGQMDAFGNECEGMCGT